jgi:cysteine/O-acetylserine efflux protein
MENIDFASLVPFILVTIYTPGPGNISCTSMGINYGVRQSLSFIYGLQAGFILVMLIAYLFSNFLLKIIPSIQPIMRLIGSVYIFYLAYQIYKTDYSYQRNKQESKPFSFRHGLLLQFLNPKLYIFILTLYTVFIYSIIHTPKYMGLLMMILVLLGFSSNLIWNSFGATISHFLHQIKIRKIVNSVLAIILVFTAIKLTGLLF